MKLIDKMTEKFSRQIAMKTSRRSFLTGLGVTLVGAASIPL